MALRNRSSNKPSRPKLLERLAKPVDVADRERVAAWCDETGCRPLDDVPARTPVRAAGVIRSVRIVPRAGADALETTIDDGRSTLTGVFLGRRRIIGLSAGRRVVFEGVVTRDAGRNVMYNPLYTLA